MQPKDVPLHAPVRTSTTASMLAAPSTITVWFGEVAVNLYQASNACAALKPLHVAGGRLCVALIVVPLIGEQETPGVNATPLTQSSFAIPGVVTQMLKVP